MKNLPENNPTYYPLTHAQKRIYYDEKIYPGTGWANIPLMIKYKEKIDITLLSQAINIAMKKNDGLRLKILESDFEHGPLQYISPHREISPDFFDFSGPTGNHDFQVWLKTKAAKPFTLFDSQLFYFSIIKFNETELGYFMNFHHLAADGWTCYSLMMEINEIYEALEAGKSIDESPNPSYTRYIFDEQAYLKSDLFKKDKDFWHNTLLPLPEPADLSSKKGKTGNIKADCLVLAFPGHTRTLMHEDVKTHKTSLFKLVLSALSIYISRYTGLGDIVIGSVGHSRSTGIHKQIMGMFVSTLIFRISIDENMAFDDFVQKVGNDTNIIIKNHQNYPFDLLATELREITGSDTGYLRNITLVGHTDVEKKRFDYDHVFAGYEPGALLIHLNAANKDKDGILELEWIYQVEQFTQEDIRRFHQGLVKVLNDALTSPGKKISEIELLSTEERKKILRVFNDTKVEYPLDKTIHDLFESQVEKTPDQKAIIFRDQQLNYRSLNERANRLAYLLREKGIKPDHIAAVLVERSLEMMVGIWGILKSGGSYLPLEPGYPKQRIGYLLKDSNCKLLLTQEKFIENMAFGCELINLNTESSYHENKENLALVNYSENLAYIIYTSGSTGKPKGVLIEHGSAVNLLLTLYNRYPLQETDAYLLKTTFMFDVSISEIFGWFWGGGRLVILEPGEEKDPISIIEKISREKITHINFVPSIFNVLIDMLNPQNAAELAKLKYIFLAGEAVLLDSIIRFRSLNTNVIIENLYGPTEAAVYSSWYSVNNWQGSGSVPIGSPIDNIKIIIIDTGANIQFHLQPVGIAGELCISGIGLSRGYLNKPELSSEKFIDNPFLKEAFWGSSFKKLYRTGDLARWLPEGNIEYLGRIDNQVKIRGFRIETGEIENQVLTQRDQAIKEAVVTAREDPAGEKYLCAYIVSDAAVDMPALEKTLSKSLQDYMIPSYFLQVEKIPLTPNGKVDRKKLPDPQLKAKGEDYSAPRDEIEEKLVEIWAEILQREKNVTGIDDNFFKLGGHSLKAAVMISMIHKRLEVRVSMHEIFNLPTIRKLADYIKKSQPEEFPAIEPAAKKAYYPLSSNQERLYILDLSEGTGIAYNMPFLYLLEEEPDRARLENAFQQLIQRQESFRTSFEMRDNQPMQTIHETVEFGLEYYELKSFIIKGVKGKMLHSNGERTMESLMRGFVRPFDLSRAPLLRASLLKTAGKKRLLLVDMHHIISDGLSLEIFKKELAALYEGKKLPPLKIQYKDYSEWEYREYLAEKLKNQEEYWLKVFSGELPVLNLPMDYTRPSIQSFEGHTVFFDLEKKETEALKELAKKENATLFMMLIAVFNILLRNLTSQGDIVVGIPVAGRRHPELENIIGMFVNTLALRNYPYLEKTFPGFLSEVKQSTLDAFENQDYPFEELVKQLKLYRGAGRNPLFDVMFAWQDLVRPEPVKPGKPGLNLQPYIYRRTTSKFDMTLFAEETGDGLFFEVEYCTKLFNKKTIERNINYFKNILYSITTQTGIKISEIEIMSKEEKNQVLYEFNDTDAEYPRNSTIHEIFEAQAAKTPGNIAVLFQDNQLSYRHLNEKCNQLARVLKENGSTRDKPVTLMVDRTMDMIIGILAILKSGGAYLPILREYPEDRIKLMLEDSSVKIVITTKELENKTLIGKKLIFLEDREIFEGNDSNPENINKPGDLAYIIFTSGTTGKPKGVLIPHKNVVRLMFNDRFLFNFDSSDIWTMFHSFCFDFSVWEMYGALLYGGKVIIITKMMARDTQAFSYLLKKQQVTILNQTPSAFYNLVNLELSETPGEMAKGQLNLKYVIFGGEALKPVKLREWRKKYPRTTLVNMYGITETTVHVTFKEITETEIETNLSNIGKPIPTLKSYAMDRELNLLPIGVLGECCVGGDGIARGYMNRPELTSEKFVQNRFNPKDTLYRSGDLIKVLENGEMEYLGRIDKQVQVRGFRVELGEIENKLLDIKGIKEAVVLAKEDNFGDIYLCCYLIFIEMIERQVIIEKLSKGLPDYMIPSYFLEVDKIPLTSNGKVDIKALPDPQVKARGESYAAARDPIEEKLVAIWSELLLVDKDIIGIDDNFFKLGGHSLKAAILITMIHKLLNVKVSMPEIFNMPTIRKLARHIKDAVEEKYISIKPVEKQEYYPQTPPQKRMFFMQQLEQNNMVYNMQVMDVFCKGIEKEGLEAAVRKMIKRHESLRTSFLNLEGAAMQRVHDYEKVGANFKVEFYESYEDGRIYARDQYENPPLPAYIIFQDLEDMTVHFVRPFDLQQPPLLRVGLVKIWGNTRILMLDMHHIVSDGISLVIFLKELWELYDGEELPPLSVQYKDFSQWISSPGQQERIKKQETYWLKEFSGDLAVLNLPYDFPRPARITFHGDMVHFEVGKRETGYLNKLAQEQGITMYMILLAAYNVLLAKLSVQEEIIVGTVTAGRSHADLHPVIGMFVNTLAIRNFPGDKKTIKEFLQEVKENLLAVFENQDYPFEELVARTAARSDLGRNPLFDVVFLMENEAERSDEYLQGALIIDRSNPFRPKRAKFDLTLMAAETGDDLQFNLEYNSNLFEKETIDRFIGYYKKIIASISGNIDQPIAEIDIIPDDERSYILYQFNDTESEYPGNKTVHELFEEQVAKTPDCTAVVGLSLNSAPGTWYPTLNGGPGAGLQGLTYRQLNAGANQLARELRDKGMKPDRLAAIMVEPSQEMILAMLSVLKSGGGFLPIDYKIPRERVEYMLQDSGVQLLLTREELVKNLDFKGKIIALDELGQNRGEAGNLENINTPGDLCYVIYTSGSTGKPKGVLGEHRPLINLCCWYNEYFSIIPNDRTTKYASFGFDASVWEIFPPLLKGAALYIIPEEIKLDIKALNHYFQENGITVSFLPTQMAEQFMGLGNTSLRVLQAAGDKLKSYVQQNYRLYNCYGPTENTVCATACLVTEFKSNIPIGKPIGNNLVYILDKKDHLQPIGVPGELCVGGESVARGYMNNPRMTDWKFIKNPYRTPIPLMQSSRLYRTGDLARWINDGNIEFLGRIDYQVKVRGYRIELGEIENRLRHIEDITEAIVTAREDKSGQKYLCAYLVGEKPLHIQAVKKRLSKGLPDYMIPSFYVQIEEIPLNPNGKIDMKALPEPGLTETAGYAAPGNEIETILAEVWSEVLGLEKVGIDDNFFEIGGDSIKIILISGRLRKRQLFIKVNDFFVYPTIRQAAPHAQKLQRYIEQGPIEGIVELTPIQRWFFEKKFKEKNHFNHVVWLYTGKRLDKKIIKAVFTKILEHHDVLRMRYEIEKNGKGEIIQRNRGTWEGKLFDLTAIDLTGKTGMDINSGTRRINRGIDIENGPLVRLGLFNTGSGDYLLVVIHHLVVDGISWRILLEDFETGYVQAEQGEEIKFQEKTDSYRYWAQRLNQYGNSPKALKKLEYWQKIENIPIEKLPKDHAVSKKTKTFKNRETIGIHLTRQETEQLLKEANFAYNTEINDLLLAALGTAVQEWCGITKVSINLEGHGRESIMEDMDLSRTVGWFTSQYPVILDLRLPQDLPKPGEKQLSYHIKQVKETLRHIPNKGIGYGILKYLTPQKDKKGLAFKLQPEISFNYHGKLEAEKIVGLNKRFQVSFGDSFSPKFDMDYTLDIIGVVETEGLKFSVAYNKYEYDRSSIEKFADGFKSNLLKITRHCVSKKEKELTPSDLGYDKISIEELARLTDHIKDKISKDMEIQSIYPLSPMQNGMLYHSLKNKKSQAYFEQIVLKLEGEIDASMLEASLNKIIGRYDILRTIFTYEGLIEPVQVVLKERQTRWYYEDISHLKQGELQFYLAGYRKKDWEKSFDLAVDLLIRFALFKTGIKTYRMMWTFHHILMDGWCFGIIREELTRIYQSLKKGVTTKLEPVTPYSEYIRWLGNQDKEEGLRYWEKYLEGYEEAAVLPKMTRRLKENDYKKEEYHFVIDEELTARINRVSWKHQVTINTVFQTLWGLILQKYNNRYDVVFGNIVSGRYSEIEGIERMVGLFINLTPVRIMSSSEGQVFSQLLEKVQEENVLSKKYEYLPMAEIQSHSKLKGDLIDHIMVFENYPAPKEIEGDFTVEVIEAYEQTNYDFNIIAAVGDCLHLNFSYNALMYESQLVEDIALHFKQVIGQVVENPGINTREIEILTEKSKNKLLYEFNDTGTGYSIDKTIHELFEDQVEKTPDKIALVLEDKILTYKTLNQKANQTAGILREKGVKPDSFVPMMQARSLEAVVSIMGILKSGAAYMPIGIGIPGERIRNILRDSGAKFLVTREEFEGKADFEGQVLYIEDLFLYGEPGTFENPAVVNSPGDLLYVIYTSGSTGKPKGVMLEHRNIINLLFYQYRETGVDYGGRVLQFASIGFDVSAQEIFSTLLAGGGLYLTPDELKHDTPRLFVYIERNDIDILFLPPAFLKLIFSDAGMSVKFPVSVKHIIAAGEQLVVPGAFGKYLQENRVFLHNHYGPTESHVVTTFTMDPTGEIVEAPPIGKPISNTKILILGIDSRKIQPMSIPGELYISGANVARGYSNRQELTEERFMTNPYVPGERMYRTGDLARWLPEGNIEYLGRIDFQVKVRGFRIELGEIENQLVKYEKIKEAVVMAREPEVSPGEKYLYAYIVPAVPGARAGEELSIPGLREYLLKELPDYMIPSFFIRVPKIPLTPNGKVDRKKLIAEGNILQTGKKYVPPRNEVEAQITEIWQKVLNLQKISIDDSFFEMGGNSLKAIQLVSLLIKNFDIKIAHIFEYRTVAGLAANIFFKKDNIKEKIEAMRKKQHPTPEEEKRRIYRQNKLDEEKKAYFDRINKEQWGDLSATRNYRHILITGATGYLGGHLLPELLETTKAKLYLPVRGNSSEDAEARLKEALVFYFGKDFFETAKNRIQVIRGDLKRDHLGFDDSTYERFSRKVDAVVHSAANVRHIGAYEDFYEENVRATERLLEYSITGKKKDFHFISTLGTCSGRIEGKEYILYHEYNPDVGQQHENVYARSKFEAEKKVLDYRKKGLNTIIYRVGFLVFQSGSGKFQKNIKESAFYNNFKAFIALGTVSDSFRPAEFSFIDYSARAITLLMTRKNLLNETFHLHNHHLVDWKQMSIFLENVGIKLNVESQDKFFDYLLANLDNDKSREEVNRFLLNAGFFASMEAENETMSWIESSRTVRVLEKIDFKWPKVNKEHIEKMVRYCREVGFI